jgi:hypothetical protein
MSELWPFLMPATLTKYAVLLPPHPNAGLNGCMQKGEEAKEEKSCPLNPTYDVPYSSGRLAPQT